MKCPIEFHEKHKGKIFTGVKFDLCEESLALAYTPGVAKPSLEIAKDKCKAYDYTIKGSTIAVITNGTAVLGLGDIGPEAALPVMEGKCILFKTLADVNAFPICINEKNPNKIVEIISKITAPFGGINLEDIKAPECFEIEKKLKERLDIPVFHDDRHGTSTVVLAGLINALKVLNKKIENCKIIINGAGAAGTDITRLLLDYGAKDIIMVDINGAIYQGMENLNQEQKELSNLTNKNKLKGNLKEIIKNADVFIGVSVGNILTNEMISTMKEPIIFALANPDPEINPKEAKDAKIIATGRSDFPNQINNALAFPGIFKGLLDAKSKYADHGVEIAAAKAISGFIKNPSEENIIPSVLNKDVHKTVAKAVKKYAEETYNCRD